MQPAEQPCLYDKLGGVYSIVTVVDEFRTESWQIRG